MHILNIDVNNRWITKKMAVMNAIPDLNITEFDYELPTERIAFQPLDKRDASKLMVIEHDKVEHALYHQLSQYLPANTHLVFNNTKVIAARLLFTNRTNGTIEVFLLEPLDGNYEALLKKNTTTWKCLIGGAKKWKDQEYLTKEIEFNGEKIAITVHLTEKARDYFLVTFNWKENYHFYEIIQAAGNTPLPPYIKRDSTAEDIKRYQTVYAKHEGSVAAPTAGLHFTDELLTDLHLHGIKKSFLTLHVGAGTFKPVTTSTIAAHTMHKEFFEVEIETINSLVESSSIIPVGTTSLRTLESLYWIGLKLFHGKSTLEAMNNLEQWEHIELMQLEQPDPSTIFSYLQDLMEKESMKTIHGHTGICITPGYQFNIAKGLITNFHQPQSTLLFIIAAMLGDRWKSLYQTAIEQQYRFLSYGDGMLILM